jgi:homopolymeric O-antigen transport system permease protein
VSDLLRSLKRNQRLFKDFVARDLRARYVGSSMGFFWSVIFPFLNLLVYMFVFRLVLGIRFGDKVPAGQTALWMLCGITVWQAFAEAISRSTNTLVENQNLIQKVVFPSEVLPLYLVVSALINMLIGTVIVLLGVTWFAYISPEANDALVGSLQNEPIGQGTAGDPNHVLGFSLSLACIPLLVFLQAVFTLGLGYLLSAFNLILRDTYHLVGVLMTVWMFATPIFYPPEMVVGKGYGWMLQINPMYWLIDGWRAALLFGEWPDWLLLGRFALVAVLLLFLGSRFFLSQKPRFPDLL